MRIAQILGKMNGGGVEQVVMNYYRHIDTSRIQFDFVVERDSQQVPLKEIEQLGGSVFYVPSMRNLLAYQSALRELLREQGWQIVHSHLNALSLFPLRVAAQEGVPVRIAHSHSSAGGVEPGKDLLKNVLRRCANTYPTHRFACSEFAGCWLFGKGAEFEIVKNAIDAQRFRYNAQVREEVRALLGISQDCLVMGHVGRFARQKNHAFLLDVFERVRSARNAALVLVGSGPLEQQIRSRVHQKGLESSVLFLGYREDVERFYQAFDVFVLPSYYEGLGVVNIEAQAAGLHCVVSDTVTQESDVSGNVVYLPLGNAQLWSKAVLEQAGFRRNVNQVDNIAQCGFEIQAAASKLAQRYCALAAQAGATWDDCE